MRRRWCGTPPHSVSLGAAVAAGCEDEDEAPAAAAVRARFFGMTGRTAKRVNVGCKS